MRVFLFLLFFPLVSTAFENVQFSGAVDLVQPGTETPADNKLGVRGMELMFYGPLDPIFDAVLNVAGHPHEGGEFEFELHEALIRSSKLVDRMNFKLGKFFLGVGRLNQTHQHDWPFIQAPLYHTKFFAAEGVADEGFETSRLWGQETPLDTTLGVTNGYVYGHAHDGGERPPHPLVYLRQGISGETESGPAWSLGLNGLQRTSAQQERTRLWGLDFVLKHREGALLKHLFQAELWNRERQSPDVDALRDTGFYAFYQRGLNTSWAAGLRVDGYSDHNKRFVTTGELRRDFDYALVPQVTWRSSEFATFRAAYTRAVDTTQGDDDKTEQRLDFQIVYLMGAHPAHEF
ncbi:MAG: hypothetical protein KF802_01895 [Bdellovibrionaceae bacterium]|nr:hypothetical protein [Pseudobdellovibrionaceae bacterium]MBX3033931.1 hypothetical protein [Pseudobdellovibrionaceae bacterium]